MAIMLVPTIVTNLWQALIGGHLRKVSWRIWPFLLISAVTIWIGAEALTRVKVAWLSALLGLLLALYGAMGLLRPPLSIPEREGHPHRPDRRLLQRRARRHDRLFRRAGHPVSAGAGAAARPAHSGARTAVCGVVDFAGAGAWRPAAAQPRSRLCLGAGDGAGAWRHGARPDAAQAAVGSALPQAVLRLADSARAAISSIARCCERFYDPVPIRVASTKASVLSSIWRLRRSRGACT